MQKFLTIKVLREELNNRWRSVKVEPLADILVFTLFIERGI
jgi:hypothetical protein